MFTKLQVTSDLVTCYILATDGCLRAINSHLPIAGQPKPPSNNYQPSSGKLGHLSKPSATFSATINHLLAIVGHLLATINLGPCLFARLAQFFVREKAEMAFFIYKLARQKKAISRRSP